MIPWFDLNSTISMHNFTIFPWLDDFYSQFHDFIHYSMISTIFTHDSMISIIVPRFYLDSMILIHKFTIYKSKSMIPRFLKIIHDFPKLILNSMNLQNNYMIPRFPKNQSTIPRYESIIPRFFPYSMILIHNAKILKLKSTISIIVPPFHDF